MAGTTDQRRAVLTYLDTWRKNRYVPASIIREATGASSAVMAGMARDRLLDRQVGRSVFYRLAPAGRSVLSEQTKSPA